MISNLYSNFSLIFAINLLCYSCKTDIDYLCSIKNGIYNYSEFNIFNTLNLYLKTLLQNGLFVYFGCRLIPFEKIKRLNFALELSQFIYKDINGGNLRIWLGLSIKI